MSEAIYLFIATITLLPSALPARRSPVIPITHPFGSFHLSPFSTFLAPKFFPGFHFSVGLCGVGGDGNKTASCPFDPQLD